MSIAKVIEVIAEGDSIQEATDNAVKDAAKSVKQIQSIYVEGIQGIVKDDKIEKYRVNAKVTFVVK